MSVEQIEATIRALPPAERARLVEWLDDHRHELVEADHVNPEVRTELELRLREMKEHPEMLEPFEEADLERMIQNTVDAHAKKSSARRR